MPLIQFDKGFTKHSSKRLVATEEEQMIPFPVVSHFDHIINEGPDVLMLGIDESTDSDNPIYLRPGQGIGTFPRQCNTLYFRSLGTSTFQCLGV